jgi:hypothetical protein
MRDVSEFITRQNQSADVGKATRGYAGNLLPRKKGSAEAERFDCAERVQV